VALDVETEIVIARPRSLVAAYACDPDNATAWYVNIESAERQTPGPITVGSRFAFVARFLGRRMEYVYRVEEIVPDERFVMAAVDGPLIMETTYAWEDANGGDTLMRLRNRGEPRRMPRLLAPLMSLAVRMASRKDLVRLKQVLESQSTAAAAGGSR
jgi:Polyketide cyclase / dehydrase and lipid transport